MNKQQRETLAQQKHEASAPKSELIRILSRVEECSAREARRLSRVIELLEAWQNSGAPFGRRMSP